MKKLLLLGLLIACLMPGLARAQSDFDGTWKVDVSRIVATTEPDVFLLQNGLFQCKTCAPTASVKADSVDHNVAGKAESVRS